MPLLIILLTTLGHFGWCYLFVTVLGYGLKGGAWALTLTYFLDYVLLWSAAQTTKVRHSMAFDIATSFSGWGEYLKIAIPGTLQLIIEWWYFELMALLSGMFPNPA